MFVRRDFFCSTNTGHDTILHYNAAVIPISIAWRRRTVVMMGRGRVMMMGRRTTMRRSRRSKVRRRGTRRSAMTRRGPKMRRWRTEVTRRRTEMTRRRATI